MFSINRQILIFTKPSSDDTDELSKLKNEAVPDDVRKWLASTFASADQVESWRSREIFLYKHCWADCQEAGRETKLTFCGQCNPYRNIHREDLQQDVYLPDDGHPPGGLPPPPDHRELEF